MRFRALLLSFILLPALAYAGDASTKVTSVINGKSVVLASGDVVRLASIETPNVEEQATPSMPGRPGEPLGPEAKQALESQVLGKVIRIEETNGKRDRHNRLLGQVYGPDNLWIQGRCAGCDCEDAFRRTHSACGESGHLGAALLPDYHACGNQRLHQPLQDCRRHYRKREPVAR
jgi:hypothetical protein